MRALQEKQWVSRYPSVRRSGQSLVETLLEQRFGSAETVAWCKDERLLHDPFLFREMGLACELIAACLQRNERILIYGDYDCDGLTSTVLLLKFFQHQGARVSYRIPDRLQEGYGLSMAIVDEILEDPPDLLITVDCGSSSRLEVERLRAAGVRVLITDHHECKETAPFADALINPCHPDESYPYKHLAGVGVALKLQLALVRYLDLHERPETAYSLAALGTVADSMRLVGENRAILALGLEALARVELPGLRYLCTQVLKEAEIDETALAFALAPRLNAAGRMGKLQPAMDLLLAADAEAAQRAGEALEALNTERRAIETAMYQDALKQIEEKPDLLRSGILLLKGEDWHPGVLGIVSARLLERFALPVVSFAPVGEEWRGSGRAPEGENLLQELELAREHCLRLGGHAQACGLSVARTQFADFADCLALRTRRKKRSWPPLVYDLDLQVTDLREDLPEQLKVLAPYGPGNERPLFALRQAQINSIQTVGNGQHVRFSLGLEQGRQLAAIAFRMGGLERLLRPGDRLDVLGEISLNCWNGRRSLQLLVRDVSLPQGGLRLWDDAASVEKSWQAGSQLTELLAGDELPRKQLQLNEPCYQMIVHALIEFSQEAQQSSFTFSPNRLARLLCRRCRQVISPFMLLRSLELAVAEGFCHLQRLDWQHYRCMIINTEGRAITAEERTQGQAYRQLLRSRGIYV